MWRRWGTPHNLLLAFIGELWKTKKTEFWKNEKKIAGDIIILHMRTRNDRGTVPEIRRMKKWEF